MQDALARKLSLFRDLAPDDVLALRALSAPPRRYPGRRDLVEEGGRQTALYLVLEGWACRYRQLPDGRRQVLCVLLPGDMCDLEACEIRESDHALATITPAVVAEIPPCRVEEACARSPRVLSALRMGTLAAAAMQREWTVNLGQRTAIERLAHFLCEIYLRQRGIGLAEGGGCPMPLTQGDMADALGITSVHVNRTLMALRQAGLVEVRRRRLGIPDLPALVEAAGFDARYLHFERDVYGSGLPPPTAR